MEAVTRNRWRERGRVVRSAACTEADAAINSTSGSACTGIDPMGTTSALDGKKIEDNHETRMNPELDVLASMPIDGTSNDSDKARADEISNAAAVRAKKHIAYVDESRIKLHNSVQYL